MRTESNDNAGHAPGPVEPIHPGEHLTEMLQELGITQYRLAKTIGFQRYVFMNSCNYCEPAAHRKGPEDDS